MIGNNFGEVDIIMGARYYDPKWSVWTSVDPMAEKFASTSSYAYGINNPINVIDPDGCDIVYLNDQNAVPGPSQPFGHAAVLIGNDKDGWRYVSMNGTAENIGDGGSMRGKSRYPDLGNVENQNDFRKSKKTLKQVMKLVNKSNDKITSHNYNRAIRIKTSPVEDEIAYQAAMAQAQSGTYCIAGSSCLDVPQEAIRAVLLSRLNQTDPNRFLKNSLYPWEYTRYGFSSLVPNEYYQGLTGSLPNGQGFLKRVK